MSWTLKITVWLYQEHENQQDIFQKISHCSLIIFANSASTKILQNYRCSSSGAGMHQGKFAAGQRRWNTSAVKVRCKRCHWSGNPFRRAFFFLLNFFFSCTCRSRFFLAIFFHMKELVHPKKPCRHVRRSCGAVFRSFWKSLVYKFLFFFSNRAT